MLEAPSRRGVNAALMLAVAPGAVPGTRRRARARRSTPLRVRVLDFGLYPRLVRKLADRLDDQRVAARG